jgi:hypothetical protein
MHELHELKLFRSKPKMCWAHDKVIYTKKEAQEAKNRRRKNHVLLRIYPCPEGNHWHLTHTNVKNNGR